MDKTLFATYIILLIILALFSSGILSLIYTSIIFFNLIYVLLIILYFFEKIRKYVFLITFIFGVITDLYLLKPIGSTSIIFFIPVFVIYIFSNLRATKILSFLGYLFVSLIFNILFIMYSYSFGIFSKINFGLIIYCIIVILLDASILYLFYSKKKYRDNGYKIDI